MKEGMPASPGARRLGRGAALAVAGVSAALGAAPVPAHAVAPPDGRVYELVSPVKKNGVEAGAAGGVAFYAYESDDGNAVLYGGLGPEGDDVSRGLQTHAVARRTAAGWRVSEPFRGPEKPLANLNTAPIAILPATDLRRFAWRADQPWLSEQPEGDIFAGETAESLMLARPGERPTWVTQPLAPADAYPEPGKFTNPRIRFQPAGATPDLRTLYFTFPGTLLPADQPRRANAENDVTAGGIYEYTDGTLQAIGTLPNGDEDPDGAVPAGAVEHGGAVVGLDPHSPDSNFNDVSADGAQLLFVSPDPRSGTGRPAQLYLRRRGQASVLVSRSELTGQEAAAGVAPFLMPLAQRATSTEFDNYAFGAPDGSHVLFRSTDRLTSDAPDTSDPKMYDYTAASGDLRYLPDVEGHVLASSDDGRRFLYAPSSGTELRLWSGSASRKVADLSGNPAWGSARATRSGSVFVFAAAANVAGFNADTNALQIFRYDADADELACLSCPPDGVAPSGDAFLDRSDVPANGRLRGIRGMTEDGATVFFDTPETLVGEDVNGQRDVYRWANGGVRLISTGRSGQPSFLLGNSASGESAVFTTAQGLDPRDVDGGYDVYDARVGGGFPAPPQPAPCSEDCQGPAPAPPAARNPGTGGANGAGNAREGSGTFGGLPARLTLGAARARGAAITLTVRTTGAGRLTVSGARIRSVNRSVARRGTVKVSVRLTSRARAQLRRRGRLRVGLRARFVPRAGGPATTATKTLTAKR